ncbi:MAG: FAD binding domain-containing protein [Egibacteraceae bacterium]
MSVTSYHEPQTLDEACDVLAAVDPFDTKVVSGGTAVVLMMQQGLIAPSTLVSLGRVGELRGIEHRGDVLRIGAGTTLTEVAESAVVRRHCPSLAYACHRVGNVRVRNVATLGGNLAEADYSSDPPSVLISLGATCTLRSSRQSRTVPAAAFITGFYSTALDDDEILEDITVPLADGDRRATYLKYVTRSSEDRPCVGVAARADFDGDRVRELEVVVGAVAATPQRLPEVLDAAAGQRLEATTIRDISRRYAESIEPMSDARGSSWYRRRMIDVFVRRALETLASPADPGEANAGA